MLLWGVSCTSSDPKNESVDDTQVVEDTGADTGTDIDTDQEDTAEDDTGDVSVVSRIEVSQQSVLVPTLSDTETISITVYDQFDNEMTEVEPIWSTNDPSQVTVADGVISPLAFGSAQLHVEVDGVRGPMVFVLVAAPVEESLVVTDHQVSEFTAVDPVEDLDVGWQYQVRLSNIEEPTVGTMIIASGDSGISGKVVSFVEDNGSYLVTMEAVPPADLFPELTIDEQFELTDMTLHTPEDLENEWTLVENDGWLELVEASDIPPPTSIIGDFSSRLKCEGEGSAPILEITTLTAKIRKDGLRLNFQMDEGALKTLKLEGSLEGDIRSGVKIAAAFEGAYTCKMPVATVPITIGPLGLLFGPEVNVGGGIKLGGRMEATSWGAEPYVRPSVSVDVGVSCEADCQWVQEIQPSLDAGIVYSEPTWDIQSSMQVQLESRGFAYADLSLALRAGPLTLATIPALEAQVGVRVSGSFASEDSQVSDPTMASSVILDRYVSGGVPSISKDKILGIFKINVNLPQFELSDVIARTPKGSVSDLSEHFPLVPETTYTMTVDMDAAHANFFSVPNIEEVVVYLYDPAEPVESRFTEIERIDPQGQTQFDYEWTPTEEDLTPRVLADGTEVMPWLHFFVNPIMDFGLDYEYELSANATVPLGESLLTWTADAPVITGGTVTTLRSSTGSIDDNGRIGFCGEDSAGESRPWTWDDANGYIEKSGGFGASRSYGGCVIGTGTDIAAVDTGLGYNMIRTWDGSSSNVFGRGDGFYGTLSGYDFGAAIAWMDMNSSGDVVFYTVDQYYYNVLAGWDFVTIRKYTGTSLTTVDTDYHTFALRPTMSESGVVVWRNGLGYVQVSSAGIISSSNAGLAPGISGHGERVAWTDSGSILTANGDNGWSNTVEFVATGINGKMSAIEDDHRLGVGFITRNSEDITFIVFYGTNLDGDEGIFVAQGAADAVDSTNVAVTPLVLLGETVDGVTVSELNLHDPVSPNGHIVVRAETGSGSALIRFTPDW